MQINLCIAYDALRLARKKNHSAGKRNIYIYIYNRNSGKKHTYIKEEEKTDGSTFIIEFQVLSAKIERELYNKRARSKKNYFLFIPSGMSCRKELCIHS